MVGRDGFEPSTNWLKANCSTTELTARWNGAHNTSFLRFRNPFFAFFSLSVQSLVNQARIGKALATNCTAFAFSAGLALGIGAVTRDGGSQMYTKGVRSFDNFSFAHLHYRLFSRDILITGGGFFSVLLACTQKAGAAFRIVRGVYVMNTDKNMLCV